MHISVEEETNFGRFIELCFTNLSIFSKYAWRDISS